MELSWRRTLEQADQLRAHLASYELRPNQLEMASLLERSLQQGQIALVEAPTGTGKTLAYLLPALELARRSGLRVLISTHTLPLQEQILKRDLPLASRLLQSAPSSALLKGMGNYLCLHKAHSWLEQGSLSQGAESEALQEPVRRWLAHAREGQRSEAPTMSQQQWQELAAGDDCLRQRCPYYSDCFYFRQRRQAQAAQLLVVNHYLLGSELKYRQLEGATLLGEWDLLIIDEAHHLVEVMTRQLAIEISEESIGQLLARFWVAPRQRVAARGWLATLRQRLGHEFELLGVQWQEVTGAVDQQWRSSAALTEAVYLTLASQSPTSGVEYAPHTLDFNWHEQLRWQPLSRALKGYAAGLDALVSAFASLSSGLKELEPQSPQLAACHQEAQLHLRLLSRHSEQVQQLVSGYDPARQVAWVQGLQRWQLQLATFDLAGQLHSHLLGVSRGVVMCSATLGGCHGFEPLWSEMQLSSLGDRVERLALSASFDWERQSLLLACDDMPMPSQRGYLCALVQVLSELLANCPGRCLILSTSLQTVRELGAQLAKEVDRTLLLQGSRSREQLLEQFAQDPQAIVLGADSFWEGIDLAGEPISLVVMTKLPFDVPSDPLIEAKARSLYGRRAFNDFLLPRALLRFQQGCGRLLRHSGERGCVVCLDSRIWKASYGVRFLKASPAPWKRVARQSLGALVAGFLAPPQPEASRQR